MNEAERNILEELLPEFLKRLEPNEITPNLRAEGIITKDDYQVLEQLTTTKQRVVKLVDILQSKLKSPKLLIPILEEANHSYLASQLQQKIQIVESLLQGTHGDGSHIFQQSTAAAEPETQVMSRIQRFYTDFTNTRLMPWDPGSAVNLNDVFINLTMRDKKGVASNESYQMCLDYAKTSGVPIIVQGEPGGGKTTLAKKICLDWAHNLLTQFKIVLMARLRDVGEAEDFRDICFKWMSQHCSFLQDSSSQKELIRLVQSVEAQEILLLLDGLDEAMTLCPELSDLFRTDFVHLKYPTIITTRPYKVNDILCDYHICYIQGLTLDQQIQFAEKYFSSNKTDKVTQDKFIGTLQANPDLQGSLSTPLLLQIALFSGYTKENYRQTDLYKELIFSLISTYNQKHPDAQFINPENWMRSETVYRLGSLAFAKLTDGEEGILSFTKEDIRKWGVDLIFVKIGILVVEENWSIIKNGQPQTVYSFLHKTMQEFFAAATLALSFEKWQKFMAEEGNRLATFDTWPKPAVVHPKKLAEAGFIFLGSSDWVQCVFCYGRIHTWGSGEDPFHAHKRLLPECPYVQAKCGDINKAWDNSTEDYVSWSSSSHHASSDFIESSLFMHFNSIWTRSSKESWKQAGLQQTFFFLSGFMSDMGETTWVETAIGYTNVFLLTSIQLNKLLTESPSTDIDRILKAWATPDTAIYYFSPQLLQTRSKYSEELHPGIFQYKTPELSSSVVVCELEKIPLTTDTTAEIQNRIISFDTFLLSGKESQLKCFCRVLPTNTETLRILLNSKGKINVLNFTEQKWPTFISLRTLSLDISASGWSECCSELIQSAPKIKDLRIFGNGDFLDFRAFDITSPELLVRLEFWNLELNSSERSIPSLITKLQPCVNLTGLDLSDSQLTAGKLLPLLQSLKTNNTKLEWLCLQWNKGLGKDIVGFKRCCQELAEFPALKTLDLIGCGLSDSSFDAVKYLLLNSASLKKLWLRQNRIQSDERISQLNDIAKQRNIELLVLA